MAESGKRSSPLLIAVAWIVVIAPTTWGLTYTVRNALKIFTAGAAAAPAASATPASAAPAKK